MASDSTQDERMKREEMKRECLLLYREVRELNQKLQEVYQPISADPENPELTLTRLRERRLAAEIKTMKEAQINSLQNERNNLYEVLVMDYEDSIRQLGICLTCAQSEDRKIAQTIDRLQREQMQHADTDAILSHKLQVALGREEESEESVLNDLKKRTLKTRAESTRLMKEMAEFVNEHFPAPRERNLSGPREERDDGEEPHRYLPMLSLVETLMNKCVDSPHDPYITLDQRYWSPHVEHLLRYNIALRHPDDDNRIKLVSFHV